VIIVGFESFFRSNCKNLRKPQSQTDGSSLVYFVAE